MVLESKTGFKSAMTVILILICKKNLDMPQLLHL